MKKQILFVTIWVTAINCNSQTKSIDFKPEVEKWKTELFLNGEVGPPCSENHNKWIEENPNYYWGMQKVQSKTFDMNSDGLNDGLFFFPAIDCVSGKGVGSDFAILIYSHHGNFLTNKNLSNTIVSKIEYDFYEDKSIYDLAYTYVFYESFTNIIKGKFLTWREDDAMCCASLSGTFEYNPFDFKLTMKYKEEFK